MQQRMGLQPAPWPFKALKPLTDQDSTYQASAPSGEARGPRPEPNPSAFCLDQATDDEAIRFH